MADKKISDLTAASNINGTDQFEINQVGVSKKIDYGILKEDVLVSSSASKRQYSGTSHFFSDFSTLSLSDNFNCVADSIRGNPFFVRKTITLDALAIRLASSGSAGALGRLAVYASLNAIPTGTPLFDSGNFATDVAPTTIVVTGINLELAPGTYYAMFNSSVSSGLIRTSEWGNSQVLGMEAGISSPQGINGIAYALQPFGPFPDLTGATISGFTTGTSCPIIMQGYLQ